jgi:hypothetical protein
MSDPILPYQTPPEVPGLRLRTAAWISSLAVGILFCAAALAIGAAVAWALFADTGGRGRAGIGAVVVIGYIFVICAWLGTILVVKAMGVRRGSAAAANVICLATCIVGVLDLLFVLILLFAVLSNLHATRDIFVIVLFALPAALCSTVAILARLALPYLTDPIEMDVRPSLELLKRGAP